MIDDATPVATATGVEEFTQYREDYLRDGFVVVRDFFTGEGFDELAGELDRYVAEVVPTLPDSDAFFQDRKSPETLKQMQHMVDPFFVEYGTREPFVSLAEALMGEPVRAQKPEWFNKPPGTDHPTPPHQDNFYVPSHWFTTRGQPSETPRLTSSTCSRARSSTRGWGWKPTAEPTWPGAA